MDDLRSFGIHNDGRSSGCWGRLSAPGTAAAAAAGGPEVPPGSAAPAVGRSSRGKGTGCGKMDMGSEAANAMTRDMQSMLSKMVVLAKEAAESHNVAVACGQAAAGVATQLLAAGAMDSEKPEAYSDGESHAEVECASESNTCAVILGRGPRNNEPCGRRCPCSSQRRKADA